MMDMDVGGGGWKEGRREASNKEERGEEGSFKREVISKHEVVKVEGRRLLSQQDGNGCFLKQSEAENSPS
jgi:hypothetical protein